MVSILDRILLMHALTFCMCFLAPKIQHFNLSHRHNFFLVVYG